MQRESFSRYLIAGTLAGASGGVTLLLVVVFALSIGLLWQYAFSSSIPVIGEYALPAVFEDIGRLPSFLWGWRWVILGLMLGGIPLAGIERAVQRGPRELSRRLPAAALIFLVGTAVVTANLTRVDRALYDDALQFRGQMLAATSGSQGRLWSNVLVALPLALVLAGVAWLTWSWWYSRWRGWLRLRPPAPAEAEVPADAWFARRQQRRRARLIVALLLGAALLITAAVAPLYESALTEVRSGELWVDPDEPLLEAPMALARPTRMLVVENTYGDGTATVALVPAEGGAAVAPPVELTFAENERGSDRVELPVADLPDGDYVLRAELGSNEGGRVGYALLQGNAGLVPWAALLVGLGVGASLGLALVLAGLLAPATGEE